MKRNTTWILLGLLGLLAMVGWSVLPLLFPDAIEWDGWYPYGMMNGSFNHPFGVWWMPFGMLAMGAFWIGVLVVVIRAIRGTPESEKEHGMRILKERLARGELSIDEYERLRAALRNER